ncbi:MAG: hypothetical protein OEW24_01625 [Chloroflexota bacterium]|nr:hypothetical protein [Chloroflexota bacterium]
MTTVVAASGPTLPPVPPVPTTFDWSVMLGWGVVAVVVVVVGVVLIRRGEITPGRVKQALTAVLGLTGIVLVLFGILLLLMGLTGTDSWGFSTAFRFAGFIGIVAGAVLLALAGAVASGRLRARTVGAIVGSVVVLAGLGITYRVLSQPNLCGGGNTGSGTDGWSATGSMAVTRYAPAAVVLPDGRVLVVGGRADIGCAADPVEAELYDPDTGTWTSAGSLAVARGDSARAVLLQDGRVLVVGGQDQPSAELYDPATGGWTAAGVMAAPRGAAAGAVSLLDGRVLVLRGNQLASADLYDPLSGTWTKAANMRTARYYGAVAVSLRDGRVLVAGGSNQSGQTAFAEAFDASSGKWSSAGELTEARAWPAAAIVLRDGRVLVAGGFLLSSAELFDPDTGEWTPTGSMAQPRSEASAVLLPDGRVLVAGGAEDGPGGSGTATAEIYDPATGRWTPAGSMGALRTGAAAVLLRDGRVLVIGGRGSIGDINASLRIAELYDPAGDE